MCGRFTQRLSWRELHELMSLIGPAQNLRPRYNAAPAQTIAAVRAGAEGRTLSMLRWGLIPAWAKEPNIGYRLINARAETAHEKPSFRAAFKRAPLPDPGGRLLRVGEGGAAAGPSSPGSSRWPDGGGFAFAGLWESWKVRPGLTLTGSLAELEPGDTLETCTILTTQANETVAPVHPRMPVILPPAAYDPWLTGAEVPLAPYPAEAMTAHPVSTLVNKPANDDERCVESLPKPASRPLDCKKL